MFRGNHPTRVDEKGRLKVPAEFKRVFDRDPSAKVLINSPAVQVLRWAQAQFPALYPGGVVDTHPLISPPPKPFASWSLR